MGNSGRALPVLRQAVAPAPDNGEAHHLAAIACFNLRLLDCAQPHCRTALDLGTRVRPALIERLSRTSCPE
ncbi:MAG: hypothetical protein SWC96_06105 [Thermodesulfobacteriota bacterium]|nr:hypothetical protein [Thermodesulfobacteriota bacterium]